ncbi:hypothetical protein ACJZ2D_016241 [Fusarium nematophilum]
MPLKQKVKILVYDRAHMPALNTKRAWHDWLVEWLRCPLSRDENRSADRPEGYPWTPEFAAGLTEDEDRCYALQAEFDEHHDVHQLPVDPDTKDTETAWRTFGPKDRARRSNVDHIHPSNVSDLRHAADGKFDVPSSSDPVKESAPFAEDDLDYEMAEPDS